MKSLEVLFDGRLVGHLYDKNPLAFVYAADFLKEQRPSPFANVIPIAPGEISNEAVYAYFENLLPEGDQRKSLEERYHVTSIFGLLEHVGWDTAGALLLRPPGDVPGRASYEAQTWTGIADIIAGHRSPKEETRATISGAQYKLLLSLGGDGSPLIPTGSNTATHILKPDIMGQGASVWASAINETIMMRAATKCGLPVAAVQYIPEVRSCLVERFDRINVAGRVQRIQQADLCQLLQTRSTSKYEQDNGPTFADCYEYVKANSTDAITDCQNLLKWVFFNLIIGNNDSHAKNISMLFTEDGAKLAPFYDLLCTAIYPKFSKNFAFKIGGEFDPRAITADHLIGFAKEIGVSHRYLNALALEMIDKVSASVVGAIEDLKISTGHVEAPMMERLAFEVMAKSKKLSVRWGLQNETTTSPEILAKAKVLRRP